ncbi:hypothetical protein L6164_024360 [Bauhinia variegata]|uniref:Uncharacterized protein n=1 Tax=Bauhinia variegata TaxID=167791 RepID=A0ACB9LXE8_BAUVA|nr:hypothetical protein L6164_024360 [Bauhinia variegata]
MGFAVLNPRESLKTPSSQQGLIFPSPKMKFLKPAMNSKPKPNHAKAKRSYLYPTRPTEKPWVNKPVMDCVKILKRGELMKTPDRASEAVKEFPHKHKHTGRTFRFGQKPELTSCDEFYAGSHMFVAAPPPSSVPLPNFLNTVTTNDASSDLRRV